MKLFTSILLTIAFSTGLAIAQQADTTIYTDGIEQLPKFQGDLEKFILANLKYPKEAGNAFSSVIVTFVINQDGSIADVKPVGKIPHPALGAEAIRVLKLAPRWIPGERAGKPVRVKYSVPVVFKPNNAPSKDRENYERYGILP